METRFINGKYFVLLLGMIITAGCTGQTKSGKDMASGTIDMVWKVIGPGGGGGVMKPTISPFNDKFVLTHCDMTGMYITTDGGENWKMKNLWNVPDDFEFDPADSNILYVATRGFLHSEDRGSGISLLLRSEDHGEKWQIIFPAVARSKKVECLQSTSLEPSDLIEGAIDGTVQKVKVDPADNSRIYLGIAPLIDYMGGGKDKKENGKASLVLSEDHGKTWRTLSVLSGESVVNIYPEEEKGSVIVFTEHSCERINEKTGKSEILPMPVSTVDASEGGKGSNGYLIYIMSHLRSAGNGIQGGVYLSRDMGKSWIQVNNGLMSSKARGKLPVLRRGFAVCESVPEVAYISMVNPESREKRELVAVYSVYKTTDAGTNWKPVLCHHLLKVTLQITSVDPGWKRALIRAGVEIP